MTPRFPLQNSAAEDQAALWAAKLDGGLLSGDERRQLDAWLAAAPEHRALLSAYCQLSTDLEEQMPSLAGIRDLPGEEASAPTTARPITRRPRPLWVGAALAAAAAVALVLWVESTPHADTRELTTAQAQRQSVALADGSRVELNAQTRLTATLTEHERRVQLRHGQVFFAVARDPKRPFFVETPAGTVRVTGTQFDVQAVENAPLQVTVLEGSVQVQPAGTTAAAPLALRAGDQLKAAEVRRLDTADLDAVLAWRQGEIVFRGAPLRDVLAAFAHHHGRSLSATGAAGEQRFGGRLNLNDLEGFLQSLESSDRGFSIHRDAHGAVQVRLRTERP